MAQKKMLAPNETIWFVPIAAIADVNVGPTQANMASDAVNLSCSIVTGYTLGMTDSDTDDSKSICDAGNAVNYTSGVYEGNLTFFREDNLADSAGVFAQSFSLLKQPAEGIWVKRIGKPATTAYATTDVVSWFHFDSDYTQDSDDGDAPKQFTVPLIPQGHFGVNVVLS